MPKVNLHGPWEAVMHGNKGATHMYIMDANHETVALHVRPGIASEIVKLPELIAINELNQQRIAALNEERDTLREWIEAYEAK
jgi:hypothetical protein